VQHTHINIADSFTLDQCCYLCRSYFLWQSILLREEHH